MNFYQNLSFRWKISLPLLLIGTLFLISSIMGITATKQIAEDTNKVGNIFLRQIDYLLQADRDLYQTLVAERSLVYVSSTDNVQYKDHAENIAQAQERVNKALKLGQIKNPSKTQKDFDRLYRNFSNATNSVIDAVKSGDLTEATQLSNNQSKAAFDELRNFIDVIQEVQIKQSAFYTEQADHRGSSASTRLLIALGIGLLVCAGMIVFVPPLIIKPITIISKNIEDIAAGDGDLTARMHIVSDDEIGRLASKFNLFMDKLHLLVSETKACAIQVSDSSEDLGEISEANRHAMLEQNQAIDMVVAAVHEMSMAIQEVAKNTNDTADQAKSANERSENGLITVNTTVAQIQDVATQLNSVSGLITEVELQVASVTSVLDVIRGIAEQTNLLALNAAIEAARAGEQGRGFAVVADEVRTLASRTQDSTADIQEMLERLQTGVLNAVSAMRTSAEAANGTVASANEAGKELNEINESVSMIAGMAVQIATAAEEQSTVIEDINRNLVAINDQAITATKNAEKTAEASQYLGVASTELMGSVSSFKV